MPVMEWNNSYSVGVEKLDKDHQVLFSLIDELNDAMKMGKGSQIVQHIANELTDYTVYHFNFEEGLMAQTGYPHLAAHRTQHQKLIAELGQIRADLAESTTGRAVIVADFLRDWLVNHIQKTDTGYSSHMREKGIR